MTGVGVLIVSRSGFGGIERRFARFAAAFPVTLYCTADAADTIARLDIAVPAERLRIIDRPGAGRAARVFALLRWFRRIRGAGIRHVHLAMNPGAIAALYGLFARWLPPYSVSVVDTTFEHRARPLERWLYRFSLSRAKAVDCLSPALGAVATRYTRHPERVLVSPCSFTDYSRVQDAPARDVDVALIARRSPEKGHELLEAARALLPPLMVITETDDPFGVLARTKVFLSVQRYENYPSQSLLEAMASACAVIATDVGDTRRLLDGSCAVLIPRDAATLAAAIAALLADAPRRAALGHAARERVLRDHTVERFAEYFFEDVV